MDTIFLDTSIFEANNFLESRRIQEVYKLAEREDIKVVLSKLTYDEILNRISKNIDESFQKFNKYRDDTRVLRNIASLSDKFTHFDPEKIKTEFFTELEKRFLKSKFEIVDYPTMNIEQVFKNYFEKKFPFSSGAKKNEFPDAFALKSIEIWAQNNGIKVLAFSKDRDMLNYKSDDIEFIEDFESYLSNKIKEIEGVRIQKSLDEINYVIRNSRDITEKIREWVESELDDLSVLYKYSDGYEIHDYSIEEININIEDYDITSASLDNISAELNVLVSYKIEIIIDDEEYMFKDYDTREWVFFETKPVLIEKERYINVDLDFEIDIEDDTVYEPVIAVINSGSKLNV